MCAAAGGSCFCLHSAEQQNSIMEAAASTFLWVSFEQPLDARRVMAFPACVCEAGCVSSLEAFNYHTEKCLSCTADKKGGGGRRKSGGGGPCSRKNNKLPLIWLRAHPDFFLLSLSKTAQVQNEQQPVTLTRRHLLVLEHLLESCCYLWALYFLFFFSICSFLSVSLFQLPYNLLYTFCLFFCINYL